jgi:hypothetical protein
MNIGMKTPFIIAILASAYPAISFAGQQNLPLCRASAKMVHFGEIKISRTDYHFTGKVVLSLIVSTDGSVHSARIVSSELEPYGRPILDPTDFHKAILVAISQSKFTPLRRECRTEFTIKFALSE